VGGVGGWRWIPGIFGSAAAGFFHRWNAFVDVNKYESKHLHKYMEKFKKNNLIFQS